MQTNQPAANRFVDYLSRHKRFGIILLAILLLNLYYGFDPRFTIINLVWIVISVSKIK